MRFPRVAALVLAGAALFAALAPAGGASPAAAAGTPSPSKARPAAAADVYGRARDAFLAGRDEEVLSILTPAAMDRLKYRSHAALWAALSRARLGRRDEAMAELAAYREKSTGAPFAGHIVDCYLGREREEEVLARARDEGQRVEARFYLGAFRLLFEQKPGPAGELLCAAASSKAISGSSEARMARSLLAGLPDAPCGKAAVAAADSARAAASAASAAAKAAKAARVPATPPPAPPTPAPAEKVAARLAPARLTPVEQALRADSLGQREQALGLYRGALRNLSDPDAAAMVRSRIYAISREAYDERAREVSTHESSLAGKGGPPNAIAVLRFENPSGDAQWAPLEKGLPALLSSDLSQVGDLTLVERVELESVLRELGFSRSQPFDDDTAARVGRLLHAGRVVVGSFVMNGDSQVELEARVVNAASGKVEGHARAAGRVEDFFGVEKDLALALTEQLGLSLSGVERSTIQKQLPTGSLPAFLAYSRGLDEEDRGNWPGAARAYGEASRLDPAFREAGAAAAMMSRGGTSRTDLARLLRSPAAPVAAGVTPPPPASKPGIQPPADRKEKPAKQEKPRKQEQPEPPKTQAAVKTPPSVKVARPAAPPLPAAERLLTRAFETDRLLGSGLLPDLWTGEAFDRRDTRPVGSGTVIVTGRLP